MTSTPTTFNDPDDTMKVTEAMERVGYVDRKSFLAMARSKGLPLAYLNTRVIRIRRVDFSAWLARRAA